MAEGCLKLMFRHYGRSVRESVCAPLLANTARINQNFDDVCDLAPAVNADVQDLWNRSSSLVKVSSVRARDTRASMQASRIAPSHICFNLNYEEFTQT